MENYPEIASKIFTTSGYDASEEDLKRLADNMALLEKRGLAKLNKRLIDNVRGIWATIAEHNFAVILLSRHDSSTPISYEHDIGVGRPPDFKVEIEDTTYWIQMKDLAKLERENRHDKIIQKIKRAAKEIKVGKYFSCMLSDNFKEGCLSDLIKFLKDKATDGLEGETHIFKSKNNQEAEIEFWPSKLSELTLGYASDLGMVDITGLVREQIKQSLLNAVGAFNWEVDRSNINLIVMEADNKEDIDICDALFGTECIITTKDSQSWSRKNDGLFYQPDFSKKVAGVIAMKRKPEKRKLSTEEERLVEDFARECNMKIEQYKEQLERKKPITDYSLVLYMNDQFGYILEDIKRLLNFEKVVYYNMRPPMEKANFGTPCKN